MPQAGGWPRAFGGMSAVRRNNAAVVAAAAAGTGGVKETDAESLSASCPACFNSGSLKCNCPKRPLRGRFRQLVEAASP